MGICIGYATSPSLSLPLILTNLFTTLFHLSSTIFTTMLIVATNARWACDFLLHHSLFHHRHAHLGMLDPAERLGIRRYFGNPVGLPTQEDEEGEEGEEGEECSVCLCKIEEGEEIKELRCDHLFHSECLDRWVGYRRRATCPLCRDDLSAPRRLANELGEEVLLFKFCSFTSSSSSSSSRDTWWLR